MTTPNRLVAAEGKEQAQMFARLVIEAHYVPQEVFAHLQTAAHEEGISIEDLYNRIVAKALRDHMHSYAEERAAKVRATAAMNATAKPGPKPKKDKDRAVRNPTSIPEAGKAAKPKKSGPKKPAKKKVGTRSRKTTK